MKKRLIAILLTLALAIPMLPLSGVIMGVSASDPIQLEAEIVSAKQLLYTGKSEQSRKYLADRIERAEAVLYSALSTPADYEEASAALQYAVTSLAPMYAFEAITLNGITNWTKNDLSSMVESVGTLSFDTEVKPEGAAFSVAVTANSDGAILSNAATRSTVAGETPFGMDMLKADGIKFWISVKNADSFNISIGHRGEPNYVYTAYDVCVSETGYVYIPFDVFESVNDVDLAKDGSLNYVKIESVNGASFAISDFTAYNEILESGRKFQYTETKISTRGEIEDGAYYKIIEPQSGKAVSYGPVSSDTMLVDTRRTFYMETAVEGDPTQIWQLAPSPSGNGTFRLINRATSNAIVIADNGSSLDAVAVNLDAPDQEWNFSASRGVFTIQRRGEGKLTASGNTVKATSSNTFKKFELYKVEEVQYEEIWSDEFDGPELDRSKWAADDGFYFGGSVSALGTDDPENIYFENGEMVMSSKYDSYTDGYQFKSMYMSTSGKFAMSYGKIEIRAKLAYGDGQFPAFWLMPSDMMNMGAGEIDIMEIVVEGNMDTLSNQIGTIHWTSDDGYTHMSKVNHMPVYGASEGAYISDDYHTYGVEIDRDQIRYYFDGIQYMSLYIDSSGKEFAFGDIARYIIINNTTKGDGYCIVEDDWGLEDEYVTKIDYVKCYLEAGEVTDNTQDYTTDDSTVYSEGIDAVLTHDYWNVNFPMDIKPDGSEGMAATFHGVLYVFDPNTNVTLNTLDINSYGIQRPHLVEYSPDGSKVSILTNQGCIVIYDTSDYSKKPVIIYNGAVIQESAVYTADSKQLVVGGYNGGSQAYANPVTGEKTEKWCFRVFDVETGELLQEINVGSDPRNIAISDDGALVAVTTTSNGTFVYNTSDWSQYAHLEGNHARAIRGVDFSSDGKLLVTSDEAGVINVWDITSKTLNKTLNNVSDSSVRRVVFSPDGKNILATSTYGAARLFDVESGELISLLGGFEGAIREIAYSPDGKYIVAAAYDQKIKVFEADGTYISTLATEDYVETGFIISKIRFTPDSSHVFISLRNFPKFVQKWALPQQADKTELYKAIENATPGTEAYDFAVKVARMKYATPDTVTKAIAKCREEQIIPVIAAVSASSDGKDYTFDGIAVNCGGYAYLKLSVSSYLDKALSITLTNTETNEVTTVSVDDTIILNKIQNPDQVVYLIKYKMSAGGTFSIGLKKADEEITLTKPPVVTVDESKFETDDFLYTIENEEVTITRCISGEQIINIPDYIMGYPVTKIAPYAFNGYGRIITHMEVTLPSTLKEIGAHAFRSCNSMRNLVLPEGLETIGDYAFYDCRLLSELDIPASVTKLGAYSLSRTGLRTLTFNSAIGVDYYSNVFDGNNRIRNVIFSDGVESFNSTLNRQFLMEKLYIPESLTSLRSNLFTYNEEKVTIYGVLGSYAQKLATDSPDKYTFVPIAAPVISGVENGAEYDIYTAEAAIAATWDHGHVAYLNGKQYVEGKEITAPGEYTLKVINGYDEYSTEIKFTVVDTTPPPYVLGDVDEDGEITIADALAALRIAARLTEAEGNQSLAADVDKDGSISVADALAILRYVAKLVDTL